MGCPWSCSWSLPSQMPPPGRPTSSRREEPQFDGPYRVHEYAATRGTVIAGRTIDVSARRQLGRPWVGRTGVVSAAVGWPGAPAGDDPALATRAANQQRDPDRHEDDRPGDPGEVRLDDLGAGDDDEDRSVQRLPAVAAAAPCSDRGDEEEREAEEQRPPARPERLTERLDRARQRERRQERAGVERDRAASQDPVDEGRETGRENRDVTES